MKISKKNTASLAMLLMGFIFLGMAPPGGKGIIKSPPGGREIMEMARDASRIAGLEAVSTLRIYDAKGRVRVRQTSMASREFDNGATEKRIIRFLEPAEVKGTGMLIYDYAEKNDEMWIYMPALRKTRRIISSEKSKSFMGSEFSNADMSAPNLDDFNYSVLRSERADGIDCWVIEVVPVNEEIMDEMGYERRVSWIGKNDFVQRKAEYYNEDDELFKRLIASNIKSIDPAGKKFMAMHMEMLNEENGRRSVMTMDKIQYNPDVKEEYFTLSYLEKI